MSRSAHLRFLLVCISIFILAIVMTNTTSPATAGGEDIFSFLPIILRPVGEESTIPNGDFEQGRTIWEESSVYDNPLIVTDDDLPPGIPTHNGNWAAWLGGDNNEEAALGQTIFVDPITPYLAYWQWVDWPFACDGVTRAVASVLVNQGLVYQSEVCIDTDTGGWVENVVDLTAFAGQNVGLRFQLVTESASFANWYLDDITLQGSP